MGIAIPYSATVDDSDQTRNPRVSFRSISTAVLANTEFACIRSRSKYVIILAAQKQLTFATKALGRIRLHKSAGNSPRVTSKVFSKRLVEFQEKICLRRYSSICSIYILCSLSLREKYQTWIMPLLECPHYSTTDSGAHTSIWDGDFFKIQTSPQYWLVLVVNCHIVTRTFEFEMRMSTRVPTAKIL